MKITQVISRISEYYYMLKAVIYRDLLVWLRYPVNAVLGIFVDILLFAVIFYGGTLIAAQAINDTIEGLIVGYFLLLLATSAYSGIISAVHSEASWGTLERHYLTPFGFAPVIFAKSVAVLLRTFISSSLVLAVMLVITGTRLELPLLTVFSVATLAISSVFGLGFATGGLSVLYKRIGRVNDLINFVFVGFIAAPSFDLWWVKFLPLAQGSSLLQRTMKDGVQIWEFDPLALAILIGAAIFYQAAGYVAFILATRRARRLGTLGDY